jgi:outer membrane protein assembly factor BamB
MGGGWRAVIGSVLAACLQAQEGTRQWAVNVGGAGGGYISYSSPALSPDGTTIYVGVIRGSGGRIIAVTREGSVKWVRDRTAFVDASPAVAADGTVYIGAGDGQLYALNPADGSVKWAYATGTFITSSPAIGADGTIYFGAADARLHAVSSTGTPRWTFPVDDIIDSSPAIGRDGTIYVGSYDRHVYAVGPDGAERWRFLTGGRVFSSPAIGADGTIYVGSADQRLYAIAPDGTRRWDYLTNGDIQSSPVLGADGTIYFAADVSFYALRPDADGERLRWRTGVNAASASTAAVRADGTIIFGADDGIVRALNPDTGALRWSYDTRTGMGNLIESSPTVAPDGSIYIGSLDGFLYKINGNGSPLSAYSSWPSFRRDVRRTGLVRAARSPNAQLANIATRALAGGGNNLVAGFVVQGATERTYMIRAVGPALARLGIAGSMPDPRLEVYSGQVVLQSNDNWRLSDEVSNFSVIDTAAGVGAFPLEPGSRDAAILRPLPPGSFTAHVGSADGQGGVALVEVYDARGGDATGRIINLSTRGYVGTGQDILIAGVVVGGVGNLRLLVRGIGPGLGQFGVPGVLARPRLELFRGPVSLGVNTGWNASGGGADLAAAAAAVAAFPLGAGSADAALFFEAQPGEYTVQISGIGGTTGEAMVEVYLLP